MFLRSILEEQEQMLLSEYAVLSARSRGRVVLEEADVYRTCFQRDRDRIIHSKAFRRLQGKTQVFTAGHGDHFRSRLTHTLEVAQISRDMARSLGLNQDLAESIALAHDVGHTPFGHAGEHALSLKLQQFGESFEHNRQSMRIVTELEQKSSLYRGLNLSLEVIEGLGKHQSPYDLGVLDKKSAPSTEYASLNSLEAQVVNLADEIAYLCHDLDDGLSSALFHFADITPLALVRDTKIDVSTANKNSLMSAIMTLLIRDIFKETEHRIEKFSIQNIKDVYKASATLVAFTEEMLIKKDELRAFLFQHFYKNPRVIAMNAEGQEMISALFDYFMSRPFMIPEEYHTKHDKKFTHHLVRDYIAGMTDSFAKAQFRAMG